MNFWSLLNSLVWLQLITAVSFIWCQSFCFCAWAAWRSVLCKTERLKMVCLTCQFQNHIHVPWMSIFCCFMGPHLQLFHIISKSHLTFLNYFIFFFLLLSFCFSHNNYCRVMILVWRVTILIGTLKTSLRLRTISPHLYV